MEATGEEINRLRGCINDLICVVALSAIWSGRESAQIVSTLLEIVGLQQMQAVLHAGVDILCRMNVARGHARAAQ